MTEKTEVSQAEKEGKIIDAVLQTENGRRFIAMLAVECGFFESSLTFKTNGDLATLSIEAKEGQRKLYIGIRNRATKSLLRKAEAIVDEPEAVVEITKKPKVKRKK